MSTLINGYPITAYSQISVTNNPNQSFSATIPIGTQNITLSFYISWNNIASYWMMSLTSVNTQTLLISNLPLVGGDPPASNILRQYGYLGIGSAYIVPLAPTTPEGPPQVGDWGINYVLVFGP